MYLPSLRTFGKLVGRLRGIIAAVSAALSTVAMVGAVVLLSADPASAHDSLVSASPAENSTVTTAPSTVSLTFDENVRAPSVIVVSDPTGKRVQQGGAKVLNKTVSIPVQVATPGAYTVAFRVVSADGHPVTGQIAFTFRPVVGAASGTPSAASTQSPAAVDDHAHHQDEPAHHQEEQGGTGSRWLIGGIAGAAAVGGFVLLVLRRRVPEVPADGRGEGPA